MKRKIILSLILLGSCLVVDAQTLYVPSGTSGIGNNSTNSNVGVGTSSPQTKLHINTPNQDTIALTIQGSTINGDGVQHYVGLVLDGDYGNGAGNSSQIRSYSNLYSNWGSSLTFHTTVIGIENTLAERMRITGDGMVGIGTKSPVHRLQVSNGDLYINDTAHDGGTLRSYGHFMDFKGENESAYSHRSYRFYPSPGLSGPTSSSLKLFSATSGGVFAEKVNISSIGNSYFNGGNLGIGTDEPTAELDVRGTIKACEVKVKLESGCDFVFKSEYKLMDLVELEQFVKTNQHLPEIASEKEMVEQGVEMKELQMKLLQKIEELTLYTIDQNKKIMQLQEQNRELLALKEEVEKLKLTSK